MADGGLNAGGRPMSTDDLPKGSSVRFGYHPSDSPQLTRSKHRREYHHILGIIDKNTGSLEGPNDQPAMTAVTSIHQIASQNGVSEPTKRLRACIEQGDLVAWRDEEGLQVCRARIEDLRAAIAEENARDEPNVAKLERLAGAIAEVRSDE